MASEYVVMGQIPLGGDDGTEDGPGSGIAWQEIGRASAATPKAAIKAATDGKPAAERTGTFVAVPVRSFQPVTRKVEQAEREVWS